MAIIPQINLFDYTEIENLGDLERFYLALRGIDDGALMEKLERRRGYGRMWNLLVKKQSNTRTRTLYTIIGETCLTLFTLKGK